MSRNAIKDDTHLEDVEPVAGIRLCLLERRHAEVKLGQILVAALQVEKNVS